METRQDIINLLSLAAKNVVADRSLAAMVRKSLRLLRKLRADEVSWADLAQLFEDAGRPVTIEVLRRTVRRAEANAKRNGEDRTAPAELLGDDAEKPTGTDRPALNADPVERKATGPPIAPPPVTPPPVPSQDPAGLQRARNKAARIQQLKETS